jgi:aspartate-semialdehyde dehydrogenase
MRLAVVGVTGMVGNEMIKVLEESSINVTEFIPVASERSVGKIICFNKKEYKVVNLATAVDKKPDIALFSAGGSISLEWAPKFAEAGTKVVDNSSAWRMDETKKLIVPEINADTITPDDMIIANPNCSTIQMVVALANLHKMLGIKRLVISTYQSTTGTGVKAVKQMEDERAGNTPDMVYPHVIDKNCLPHCDVFTDNGYTKEEMKLVNETRKILNDNTIGITATAVRVPVVGGHSESVNAEFNKTTDIKEVYSILESTEGVIIKDDIDNNIYPMPVNAHGKNEVFVGRVREDFSQPNTYNMWIVADNIRKGAATNTVQIAEYMIKNNLI